MKQISVEITQKCPNRCLHCSSLADRNCVLKIETDQAKKVIDSAARLHTEILSISGGEPFLHTGLTEIAAYAKAKGLSVYIYTCGVVFNDSGGVESISEEMLRELNAIAVDKIIFDIPAIDEAVYDRFMGSTGYQKFAFESVRAAHRAGLCTEIHFVPTKINLGEVENVIHFARELGINQVSFLGLVPHGRADQNKDKLVLSEEENRDLKEKLAQMTNQQIRIGIPLQLEENDYCCYAGRNKLCIRYDGLVFGCEAFKYIQLCDNQGCPVKPDSIYDMSLEDIYANSTYLKLEREFVVQYLSGGGCGEKCPVQRMLRTKLVV